MGIVATLSALVLGLLIASAKVSYDAQSSELTQMSAKVVLLDRLLAHYCPERRKRVSCCAVPLSAFSIRHGRESISNSAARCTGTLYVAHINAIKLGVVV
jgi:hypothetical protein